MASPHRKRYDEQKMKLALLSEANYYESPTPGPNRKKRRAEAKRKRALEASRRAWDRLMRRS